MEFTVLIAILMLVVLLIIGLPVPFVFATVVLFLAVVGVYDPAMLLHFGYAKINSMILLAMPLFIMAGGIMARGGIGERLVTFVEPLAAQIKGGMGVASIVACGVFGAISGSAAAALSAIGSMMFPEMAKRGYPRGHCAALMSSASVLALLIPPSIDMILFGWLANVSIAACFLATVGPGIFTMITLSLVNCWLLRHVPLSDKALPIAGLRGAFAEFGKRGGRAFWALLMPIIVLGGIYGGIFTPTEAAAVSVVYAIPVALFVYRGLNWRSFRHTLVETGTTAGAVMVMLFFALILSQLFVRENVPHSLAVLLTSVSENKYVVLLMINFFLLFIGMIMDDVSGMTLCTPLLLPIIHELGIHPLQFAAIIGTNLGLGNVTPPVAPLLYLSGRVSGAETKEMLKPSLIFVAFGMLPGVLLATYWPPLSLWLPTVLGFVK